MATHDEHGALFFLDCAKTGRAAAGTLTQWSEALLRAHVTNLVQAGALGKPVAAVARRRGVAR
jgi:hypothetical protein